MDNNIQDIKPVLDGEHPVVIRSGKSEKGYEYYILNVNFVKGHHFEFLLTREQKSILDLLNESLGSRPRTEPPKV